MKHNYYNQGLEYCRKQLGGSRKQIAGKCSRLGLKTKINKKQTWGKQEIEFLERTYKSKGALYCSKILKRAYQSVQKKARRLNLKCKKTIISDKWLIANISKGHYLCLTKLNCSSASLNSKIKRLDMSKQQNRWTNDEIVFLTDHYSILGPKGCQEKINRSLRSITDKANSLGLRTRNSKRVYVIEAIHCSFWHRLKAGAKYRKLTITIIPSDVWKLFLDQDKKCLFCNDTISLDVPITGSLDRIDNKIGYVLNNIQLTCIKCNMMKGRHSDSEFIEQAIKISKNYSKES